MKQKLIIGIIVLVIFAAGFLAGIATDNAIASGDIAPGYDFVCRDGTCNILLYNDATANVDCFDRTKGTVTGSRWIWASYTYCNGLPR